MNPQLIFNTSLLLSGNNCPHTGNNVITVQSNEITYTAYASGVTGAAYVTLAYPSPFFVGEFVPFTTFTITGNGYQNTMYMNTPIPGVRASVSGDGYIWLAATQQG